MQLIFLDRNTLAYKDNGFVDKTFEINLDLVIVQKSSFVVNKINLNASIGDMVVLKGGAIAPAPYIGIIERMEVANKFQTTVVVLDIRELFSIDVPVMSYSGDLALYLDNLLSSHFKTGTDPLQNLSYLTIVREASVQGELAFEPDKILAIASAIELVSKTYGLRLTANVTYLRGRITGLVFRIGEVSRGIKLRSNYSAIQDLVINESSSQMTNKVVFYPKTENVICTHAVAFFLLTNGEISTDMNHPLRYKSVSVKSLFYSDADFPTLATKARSEMLSAQLDHNITFSIKTDNDVIKPLVNLQLGDFVEFYHGSIVYDSVVTGIRFKDGFAQATITLGEYRIRLTEKIQLLNKSVNTAVSNISITNTNMDGGEF